MTKVLIVFLIVIGVFGVTNYKSKEFKMLYGYLMNIIKK